MRLDILIHVTSMGKKYQLKKYSYLMTQCEKNLKETTAQKYECTMNAIP